MSYYNQLSATSQVKVGMTKLIGMVVSSTSSWTIAFHDSDAAATTITVIATMTPAAGSYIYFGAGGITFSKGLYVVIANTLQCTLIYE